MNWRKEFPQQSGWYWFYGWPWGKRALSKPVLGTARVVKISNGYSYIYQGSFIYKSQAVGFWSSLEIPNLPNLTEGEQNVEI